MEGGLRLSEETSAGEPALVQGCGITWFNTLFTKIHEYLIPQFHFQHHLFPDRCLLHCWAPLSLSLSSTDIDLLFEKLVLHTCLLKLFLLTSFDLKWKSLEFDLHSAQWRSSGVVRPGTGRLGFEPRLSHT